MVGCSDDGDPNCQTFLECYDGVFWYWKHETASDKQGGFRFNNDSTRIVEYFSMKYSPPNCWYQSALDISENYGVEYVILENSIDKLSIQYLTVSEEDQPWIMTYVVIGKRKDTLRIGGPGHYTYFLRNKVSPIALTYCDD